jgi:hypothetical protein
MDKDFVVRQHIEVRTACGQLLEVECRSGSKEPVQAFFKEQVACVSIPVTLSPTSVEHGAYGRYSRYRIKQHKYAGGGPGESGAWCYIELIEIENPPEGRAPLIIHRMTSWDGGWFAEWNNLSEAQLAYETLWGKRDSEKSAPELPGFVRLVKYGFLTPWFYAVGEEELIGDFTFPFGLEDDPTYRIGRTFVVYGWEGVPSVKTCMGTRFVSEKEGSSYYDAKTIRYRLVCFDDGSFWNERVRSHPAPRPLEGEEVWVTEAVSEFRRFLAGKVSEFEIKLTNGQRFVGKLKRQNSNIPCSEGRYNLRVKVAGEKKAREGHVDFVPSPEHPDVVRFVTNQITNQGKAVEHIEVLGGVAMKGGKKWQGAYYAPRR